jgi:ParB family chromosome partitioning protein
VIYVGADAYEKAGGIIPRDLFEQDRGGWYQDPALLEQLVFEKLKTDADALKQQGRKWVDGAIDFSDGHASGMRRRSKSASRTGARIVPTTKASSGIS